jgi:hypothetical protein
VGEEAREVLDHRDHVARLVEHHERAGARHVLERDAPPELARRQERPRRPADLHRLGATRAGVVEHLPHRDAERVLVDAGARDVARDRQELGAGRLRRADGAQPVGAVRAISAAAASVSTLFTTVGRCR